jgi:hypothetical protein
MRVCGENPVGRSMGRLLEKTIALTAPEGKAHEGEICMIYKIKKPPIL